ncbi:hypothetical protein KW850_27635 [Bacillus sp. sid0103]|nr:hypothetical protein [Bacillus sp. sid0103]MBV7508979.1 hypothetical protein [Bacillus sp. sid0103]
MDAELKTVLKRVNLTENGVQSTDEYFVHIASSNDGNYIVLTSNDRVLILGFEDLTPIQIEELEYACFAEFSKDDTYFLVGTWSKGFVFENNLKGLKL